MSNDQILPAAASTRGAARTSLADRLISAAARRALPRIDKGRLNIAVSGYAQTVVAGDQPGHEARVEIAGLGALWRTLRSGKLGFAESYMDGAIEVDDLEQLFHFFLENEDTLATNASRLFKVRRTDRRYHESRDNTRTGSRRNIAAHYDLGNAFYRLWLDAGMSYSSGIYASDASTLADAQALKHQRILEALDLQPGHSVLEIGCGWGSMAELAARRGASIKGITISAEQLSWARDRLAAAGLDRHAEIAFEDYRDTTGTFDRLVSIEMIEAVGEAHWPAYFRNCADRLAPGGRGVIQAITIAQPYFEAYRSAPDFIQRYIFPGGMLPTIEAMQSHATAAGLHFTVVERFGASYARTLRDWRDRFNDAWPRIQQLGFDERFKRMWNYYLAYCAVAFERGCIDVGLYRLDKSTID